MRILAGWDDESEAELLELYLNVDDNEVTVCIGHEQFLSEAQSGGTWDIILMTASSPDIKTAYAVFDQIRHLHPDCPIVGACQHDEVFQIARFLTSGMRSYLIRDTAGDFMFLLQSTLEGTLDAVRAERERLVSERLREEVESVRKLQESIIPQDLCSPDGYDICARYESSQIKVLGGQPVVLAGGDYYDVFMLDDDSVVLLLGDASGHGMKACMSIMTMHTLVRMIRSNKYRDTAAFVADVNRRLCDQKVVHEDGGFITLLYGILNAREHTLQWTSAGHPMPLMQNLESNSIEALGTNEDGGLPLGIVSDAEYEVHTSDIPPNSRLLLYTDGLEEAFPDGAKGSHKDYGVQGIRSTLTDMRSGTLEQSLKALFDDSTAHTQGSGRHDDTSVLMLERLGKH